MEHTINEELLAEIGEIKNALIKRFALALDSGKELSAETLGTIGEVIAKFEKNEIKKTAQFSISDMKEDLLELILAFPIANGVPATTTNKKDVL